jgi:inorganic triphosphatase YgiF
VPDHLETEQKYEADDGFMLPSLDDLPGIAQVTDPELYRLDATYFDTPDLALIRNKVTLRRRTGGPDEGWHLKLPVSAGTRQEVHEPLSAAASATEVPLRLSSRVEHLTAGRPLHPIANLHTERTVRRLLDHAGTPHAEVADDHVTAQRLSDPRTPATSAPPSLLAWREIEIELTGPELPGLLATAGKVLTDAGARPARSASKLGRLLSETAPSEQGQR